MHPAFGKVMKYVLRVILVFILSLLLVGLIKYRGDVWAYFRFLNTRDRNQARGELSISKPATFADMFRWEGKGDMTGTELLSGELLTGIDILSGTEFTGIDAYDPSLEDELNTTDSNSNSGFGFKSTEETTTPTATGSAKEQLLNLIRQRELKK